MSIIVTPLVVYSTYIAVKLHFDRGSYDAFKFNFKGPTKRDAAFKNSKDRYVYEKLARKFPNILDLIYFLVANTLDGKKWIRDMDDDIHLLWVAKMQRMQYQFSTDMSKLYDYAENRDLSFDDCLKPQPISHDIPILKLATKGTIQTESVIIVDMLVDFLSRINKNSTNDPLGILSDSLYMMQQYKPFIVPKINMIASKNVIIDLFSAQ